MQQHYALINNQIQQQQQQKRIAEQGLRVQPSRSAKRQRFNADKPPLPPKFRSRSELKTPSESDPLVKLWRVANMDAQEESSVNPYTQTLEQSYGPSDVRLEDFLRLILRRVIKTDVFLASTTELFKEMFLRKMTTMPNFVENTYTADNVRYLRGNFAKNYIECLTNMPVDDVGHFNGLHRDSLKILTQNGTDLPAYFNGQQVYSVQFDVNLHKVNVPSTFAARIFRIGYNNGDEFSLYYLADANSFAVIDDHRHTVLHEFPVDYRNQFRFNIRSLCDMPQSKCQLEMRWRDVDVQRVWLPTDSIMVNTTVPGGASALHYVDVGNPSNLEKISLRNVYGIGHDVKDFTIESVAKAQQRSQNRGGWLALLPSAETDMNRVYTCSL